MRVGGMRLMAEDWVYVGGPGAATLSLLLKPCNNLGFYCNIKFTRCSYVDPKHDIDAVLCVTRYIHIHLE